MAYSFLNKNICFQIIQQLKARIVENQTAKSYHAEEEESMFKYYQDKNIKICTQFSAHFLHHAHDDSVFNCPWTESCVKSNTENAS